MIIKPVQLGAQALDQKEVESDKRTCRVFGPCGVGAKALYLNSFFIDRRYYLPWASIQRVYKRVAMSKGGFTGKGIFGSMPYLVVEFDNGTERQFNFKYETQVDELLACLAREHPELKLHSARAEAKLAAAAAQRAAPGSVTLSEPARKGVAAVGQALEYLEKRPDLTQELSQSARRQRAQSISKPVWRWVAFAIVALGLAAAVFGIYELATGQGSFGLYFTLFGLAAVFLFSGVSVIPTARNNKKHIARRYELAKEAMEEYLKLYPGRFPLPARYAHPVVLRRMRRAMEQGRAAGVQEALEAVKTDLKALNAHVQVSQEEYDEVVAIKAMFLNENYT